MSKSQVEYRVPPGWEKKLLEDSVVHCAFVASLATHVNVLPSGFSQYELVIVDDLTPIRPP